MPTEKSAMCIEPPLPWLEPVARPNSSHIMRSSDAPFASVCPWPRCVEVRKSSFSRLAQTPAAKKIRVAVGTRKIRLQKTGFDPGDNIDIGTAIIKNNLDRYHNDLAKALVAYYAGGAAVTDWSKLREDERRYVWSVYRNAIAFRDGKGPV